MARHYTTSTGERKAYTPRQQKQLTMQALGLDINNPADNRTYKSIYDDLARRTRQYNILQDLPENSKLRPADVLFDIAHARLSQGITEAATLNSVQTTIRQRGSRYSPTVQNLYNQSLQSNTARFAARVKSNPLLYIDTAIKNELNIFSKFLDTKWVDNDREIIEEWLNEPQQVIIDLETGERVTFKNAADQYGLIDSDKYILDSWPRRALITNIREVRKKLEELAADRKRRYKRIYIDRQNNIYRYEVKQA